MKTTLLILVATLALSAQGQNAEYVCTPCGGECDLKVYNAPGNCSACNMPLVDKSTVGFTNLTPKEFCARISANKDAVILDVRSPGEFGGTRSGSYGHFKNAININITELDGRVGELAAFKDREILVYCSHSRRSPRASHFLGTQGFKNVKNLAGGVSTVRELSNEDCFKDNYIAH